MDDPFIITVERPTEQRKSAERSTEQKKSADSVSKKSSAGKLTTPKTLKTLKLSSSDSKDSRTTNSSNSGSRDSSPRTPSSSPRVFSSKKKSKTEDEYLIAAVRNGNTNAIVHFLDNPTSNPNLQCISTLNTLIHIAVVSHYPDVIKLFLQDPRVNSRIRNRDGRIPIQCIHSDEIPKLKKIYEELEKRKRIDEIIDSLILLDEEMTAKNIASETLMKKIYPWYQTLSQSLPHYATIQFMHQMVCHRIGYNRATILMLIADQKQDPNQQDALGETPLHYATYIGDIIRVKALLTNPMVNTLIKNWEGKTAQQIILPTNAHSEDIRIPSFIRSTIDILINKEIAQLGATEHLTFKLDDLIFKGIVQKIKDTLLKIQTTQKQDESDDRQLPDEAAVLPHYVTDKFFLEIINERIRTWPKENLKENQKKTVAIKLSNEEDNLYL